MKIVLVSAPFASTNYPSLALGVLKAVLVGKGHTVDVQYLNLLYAKLIGDEHYDQLSDGASVLTGEALFSVVRKPTLIHEPRVVEDILKAMSIAQYSALVSLASDFVDCAAELLLSGNPDAIGFSSTFFQREASLALAQRVKERNESVTVIFGGADCESPMGEGLLSSHEFIDAVFHGDAEEALPAYLGSLECGSCVALPGVTVRIGNGNLLAGGSAEPVDLETLPTPNFDDYAVARRLHGNTSDDWQLLYESSRGCWWGERNHCTFCGLNGRQMSYRKRSAPLVARQLLELKQRYGARQVLLADNIVPSNAARDLLPALRSVSDLTYFFEVKANLKRDDFRELQSARVTAIQPGLERLNTQVLRVMKKGTSAYQNIQLLRWGVEYGVSVYWNYLLGFSGEDPAQLRDEVQLLRKIQHLPPPHTASRIRVDRFSPMFNQPDVHGIKILKPQGRDRWQTDVGINQTSYFFDSEFLSTQDKDNESIWQQIIVLIQEWKSRYSPGQLTYASHAGEVVVHDLRGPSAKEIVLSGATAASFLSLESRPSKGHATDLLRDLRPIEDLNLHCWVDESPILLPTRRALELSNEPH